MAMTQCKNGHYYDTDTHASCPYCSSQQPIIDFSTPDGFGGATQAPADWGGSRARDDSHTQAPAGWGSADSYGGRTMPPSGWKPPEAQDEGKTMPIMNQDVFDPDVGWLVCIAGPDRGRSFSLKAKGNTIGRSGSHRFDISLDKDRNLSREAAVATVSYDAKRNSFVFICGESSILYVNGQVAESRMALHPFDAIEIGNSDTMLLFVPLCGERFDWSAGLKKEWG